MGNMSYCRFENTVNDLRDCLDAMDDKLSEDETLARLRLIKMCVEIALDHGDKVDRLVIEEQE